MTPEPTALIKYGFRREGIHYELSGRRIEIDFTWCNGDRVYTETINNWTDGEPVSDYDKERVLRDVLRFTKGFFRRSIVVINSDDPSRQLWERVCRDVPKLVRKVEYTSEEEQRNFEREMYLGFISHGEKLSINDREIRSERELDEVLAGHRREKLSE